MPADMILLDKNPADDTFGQITSRHNVKQLNCSNMQDIYNTVGLLKKILFFKWIL